MLSTKLRRAKRKARKAITEVTSLQSRVADLAEADISVPASLKTSLDIHSIPFSNPQLARLPVKCMNLLKKTGKTSRVF